MSANEQKEDSYFARLTGLFYAPRITPRIIAITAITSKMWINPPVTWYTKKESTQIITSITAIMYKRLRIFCVLKWWKNLFTLTTSFKTLPILYSVEKSSFSATKPIKQLIYKLAMARIHGEFPPRNEYFKIFKSFHLKEQYIWTNTIWPFYTRLYWLNISLKALQILLL